MLKAREDVLNSFKSNLFPIISDTTPYSTLRETSINEDSFINEIINDAKGISNKIFYEYVRFQNLSFLAKDLIKTDQSKNKQIVKQTIIKKEVAVNEKPNKIIDFVEKKS